MGGLDPAARLASRRAPPRRWRRSAGLRKGRRTKGAATTNRTTRDAGMLNIFIGWDSRFPEPADVLRLRYCFHEASEHRLVVYPATDRGGSASARSSARFRPVWVRSSDVDFSNRRIRLSMKIKRTQATGCTMSAKFSHSNDPALVLM